MLCGIYLPVGSLQFHNDRTINSFCQKHIIFQLENIRAIMRHDTKG